MKQRGSLRLRGKTWLLRLRKKSATGRTGFVDVRVGSTQELPTKAAARRAADRYIERISPRVLNPGSVMAWADWCDRYVDTVLVMHAKGTRRTQGSIIDAHLRSAFACAVHEIDDRAVQAWVLSQLKAGAAASTVAARFGVLRRMLRQAETEGLAATPPTSRKVRLPKDEQVHLAVRQKAFTDDECALIFGAASPEDCTAFALMRYVGLRGSEVVGLQWPLIDLEKGTVTVRQQALDGNLRPLKTDGSRAVLQAPQELLAILRDYREGFEPGFDGYLFNDAAFGPQTATVLRDRLYGYCDNLGIRRRGLHGFRHACALGMADAGVNPEAIRRAMRHSSLRVTAIYLSAAPEDIAAGLARGARRAA